MTERQAVVLIHGVGEQRPMDTLRRFVDAVWLRAPELHDPFLAGGAESLVLSKPDPEIQNTRRLVTPQNRGGIRTDFYEFYWAHLMKETTYLQVFLWAKSMLFRSPSTVPPQLRASYWLLVLVTVAIVFCAVYAIASGMATDPKIPWWLSALFSVTLLPAIRLIVLGTIGDAARYLNPDPSNVQVGNDIREAGVKLLETLHERAYDRIIVVGHSLGSVIGYDILTHTWPRYNEQHTSPVSNHTGLDALEALTATDAPVPSRDFQDAQRAYLNELIANGNRWRVTDFVTLGSPLAHAALVCAHNPADLRSRQRQREFPTCPPVVETLQRPSHTLQRFSFEVRSPGATTHRVPHHAAVFAPTRWTNLYFPSRGIIIGDLVGGPVAPAFGAGVRDVAIHTNQWSGVFSHTRYWAGTPTSTHLVALRDALDLTDARNLRPPEP